MTNFPDIPSTNDRRLTVNNESGETLPFREAELLRLMEMVEECESIRFKEIELVYVDEQEIVRINSEYLDRNYVTDIITFRYDENTPKAIEGTLYCCSSRIIEQSAEFDDNLKIEYLRVFVHGLIHLAGYDDQTPREKERMTELEDRFLDALNSSS